MATKNKHTDSVQEKGDTATNRNKSTGGETVTSRSRSTGAHSMTSSNNHPRRWINAAATMVFILFTFWIMAVKNGFMLRWYDEMSLFEPTRFFFRQLIYYPGGIFRYAGAYLTQLMYYPWLGTAVITLLWLLIAWMSHKAFGLRRSLYPLSLIVPMALLVSVVQLDEAWLSLKTTGYVFSNTLGYLYTIAAIWIYKAAGQHDTHAQASHDTGFKGNVISIGGTCRQTVIGAVIALSYCLAGYFALLAALVCMIRTIIEAVRSYQTAILPKSRPLNHVVSAVVTAIVMAIVPPLYYHYFPGNLVDNDLLYLAGLPHLLFKKFDLYLWWPFIIITLCITGLGIADALHRPGQADNTPQDTSLQRGTELRDSPIARYIGLGAMAACMIWGVMAERKSESLRATVVMLRHLEDNNWNGMLNVMGRLREAPNYSMLVLANLATVKSGGEARDLSRFQPYNKDARHAEAFTMTAFIQVPVNYHIGRLNQSYRWSMEHTVQYGKRAFFLKYMVKDALLRGETELARKYNDMLLATMFHRRWAKRMIPYIDNPELLITNREFNDVMVSQEKEREREARKRTSQAADRAQASQ